MPFIVQGKPREPEGIVKVTKRPARMPWRLQTIFSIKDYPS